MKTYYIAIVLFLCTLSAQAQTISTLGAPYVVVDGESLLHSFQVFDAQPSPLLDQIDQATKRLGGRLVKLNVVAVDNATVDALTKEVHSRYAQSMPVITVAVGKLSKAEFKLGIDSVIAFKGSPKEGIRVEDDAFGRIMHPGSQIYVSGQAERSGAFDSATESTMSHLGDTLLALDAKLDDVVQIRVFLTPIRVQKRAQADIEKIIGQRKIPVTFVEWNANLPAEIELVASSPINGTKPVEFITPLGMGNSPLFSRVVRVNSAKTIYIGGLYGTTPGELKPDVEVKEVFAGLQAILEKTGSDMLHLVKATYFCTSDDVSNQLNALRPNYFDQTSPPAASKAMVSGVGQPARTMTMDMIAVPK